MTPAFLFVVAFILGLLVAVAGVIAAFYFRGAEVISGTCVGLHRMGIERLSVLSEAHGWVEVTPGELGAALVRAAEIAGDKQAEREAWREAQ